MSDKKAKVICVDFDGVIYRFDYSKWEKDGYKNILYKRCIISGARVALKRLRTIGYRIVVYTSRVTSKYKSILLTIHHPNYKVSVKEITKFLKENNICFDEVWEGNGKPVADVYLDDKAVRFLSWPQAMVEIKEL